MATIRCSATTRLTAPPSWTWERTAAGSTTTQLETYLDRLYALDEGANQIYRYPPGQYDQPPGNWFDEGTEVNIVDARSLRIDGDIWILFDDGKVVRYRDGEQLPYSLDDSVALPADPVDLWVGQDADSALYVVDAAEQSVLLFDKDTGGYRGQFRAAEGTPLQDLRGLFIDNVRDRIFLLTGDRPLSAAKSPLNCARLEPTRLSRFRESFFSVLYSSSLCLVAFNWAQPPPPPRRKIGRAAIVFTLLYAIGVLGLAVTGGLRLHDWARQRIVQMSVLNMLAEPASPSAVSAAHPQRRSSSSQGWPPQLRCRWSRPLWQPWSRSTSCCWAPMSGPTSAGPSRTDTMIVLSVNPETGALGMISLPRDLWVPIPGQGITTKINTAYMLGELNNYPGGGPQMVKDTVSSFLGRPVDYFVQVNFDGFREIVDLIGGVDIDSSAHHSR